MYPENLSSPVTFIDLGFCDGSPTLLISNTVGASPMFISVTFDDVGAGAGSYPPESYPPKSDEPKSD